MNFFRKNATTAPTPLVDGLDGSELLGFETSEENAEKKQLGAAGGLEMTVMNPSDFSDVTPVAEEVLRGVTVVLNLDKLNKEDSRRFLDFLGGVIFSIDGGIKKVAASTYVVTPRNVDVYDSSRLATRENIGDFDR